MQQKAKNGSKKTHFFDFATNYIEGTDCNMDDLAEKLRVVSFEGGFPLQIERDEFENEMNDEFMRELITQTHCGNNKLFIIDKMKEK